ncbi:hypothetical protein N658DRAFT_493754 [Parathielavia hyrcaniae]|uniref:Indoleamine 2,3-dioxygenase n=1 Tax=Parathielavia hyrcaniae TaxID=113614 RepID=A0AAN6Q638_9PEZI|nr:hypothetical protein N658DRAFT_493754 [Parathielavia hyrcaniae]
MGPLEQTIPPFPVLDDTRPQDTSLPAFMVSTTRGFLPRMDPIVALPPEFDALESILQRMPVKTLSGEPGLLAAGTLGETVVNELLDLTDAVDRYRANLPLMNALYRDYSFLASAYLLEPCHQRFVQGEGYGLARDVLPVNIARPIAKCAELCGFKPFMEYAGSYALFNYRLADPSAGLASSNLRLIRAFEHGLDPASSEAGFVLVHVEMVKHSGPLVAGAVACIQACASRLAPSPSPSPRQALNAALSTVLSSLQKVNATMETMWTRSRPTEYTSFRTFIFGITSQSMFPNGVLYSGVPSTTTTNNNNNNNNTRVSFRGESGANDSMIPLVDNLLSIPMPTTPLTKILQDFRSYRPGEHRRFLEWVQQAGEEGGLKGWALGLSSCSHHHHSGSSSITRLTALENGSVSRRDDGEGKDEDEDEETKTETRALWIQVLDQVRDFRWRHWCFAREYILKRTSHPTATGGSPIVTWLPNQLAAVMDEMVRVYGAVGGLGPGPGLGREVEAIMDRVGRQREMLRKEVRRFCKERGVEAAGVSDYIKGSTSSLRRGGGGLSMCIPTW